MVLSLEVSRLARNSPDWHHLMYLCRWTRTLMADENDIYDLSLGSDRMVLGLRGQISELEIDNSIHRMVEARWSKAHRGEVMTGLPPVWWTPRYGSSMLLEEVSRWEQRTGRPIARNSNRTRFASS